MGSASVFCCLILLGLIAFSACLVQKSHLSIAAGALAAHHQVHSQRESIHQRKIGIEFFRHQVRGFLTGLH
jgi:hypothetical protein